MKIDHSLLKKFNDLCDAEVKGLDRETQVAENGSVILARFSNTYKLQQDILLQRLSSQNLCVLIRPHILYVVAVVLNIFNTTATTQHNLWPK